MVQSGTYKQASEVPAGGSAPLWQQENGVQFHRNRICGTPYQSIRPNPSPQVLHAAHAPQHHCGARCWLNCAHSRRRMPSSHYNSNWRGLRKDKLSTNLAIQKMNRLIRAARFDYTRCVKYIKRLVSWIARIELG